MVASIAYFSLLQPAPEIKSVEFTITKGQNTAEIADNLAGAGVISNAYTFRAYASLTQAEARLQPGKYKLKTGMKYEDLVEIMTKVKKKKYVPVLIPEGFTATQIAKRLAAKTDRPAIDFYEFIRGQGLDKVRPAELPPEVGTAEGYLFPKTYQIDEKEHPQKIIGKLIDQFSVETAGIDWSFAKEKGLSRHEIVTIASMIEMEARLPEERTLMSAVIYNRIEKGMPLQIDATVQYALPKRKEYLTNEDLKIASPYNTYQQIGLPPGPIANPGLQSIKAALAPADVDYIYYVLTSPDGAHTFTNNYQDFLKAKRRMNEGAEPDQAPGVAPDPDQDLP